MMSGNSSMEVDNTINEPKIILRPLVVVSPNASSDEGGMSSTNLMNSMDSFMEEEEDGEEEEVNNNSSSYPSPYKKPRYS